MINEQLLSATRRLTESRILDMIKRQHEDKYTLEEVQAAKIVAQERGLTLPSGHPAPNSEKSEWSNQSQLKSEAPQIESQYNQIEDELPPIPIESTETPNPFDTKRSKKKSGFSYWWVFFIIYMIIKFVARNS